jgi:pimeloyl-ACP methyl ester carboxylesterase
LRIKEPDFGSPAMANYTDNFIAAQDGLKLFVRVYGKRTAEGMPVVCLPGLARSGRDFDRLATALATSNSDLNPKRHRCVVTLDARGRGRSDFDRNPRNYNVAAELSDVLAMLTALELGPAIFVGTSRGGILAMLLACVRPAALAGVILNDIGPVIEPRGLLRIKSYVGKMPRPRSYEEGAEVLRRLFVTQFPKLTGEDWIAFARRTYKEQHGALVPDYDAKLSRALDRVGLNRPLPSLWKEFDAMASIPTMVVRGANSDVLTADTVAAMRARRQDLETLEVADQGHAPMLMEDDTIRRIGSFISRCENARLHPT